MGITRPIGVALMLVVAGLAGFHAVVNVMSKGNPEGAVRLMSDHSQAQSTLSDQLLLESQRQTGAASRATMLRAADHARATLRSEPSDAAALRTLALLADAKVLHGDAARLMNLSRRYSSRDLPALLWLMQYWAAREDAVQFVRYSDIALRTNPAGYDAVLPILANTVAVDSVVPVLAQRMRSRAVWSESFWFAVSGSPASWSNGVRLMQLLKGAPSFPSIAVAREWIGNMVARDQLALAARAADALTPAAPVVRQGLSTQAFGEGEGVPPFAWQLSRTGQLDAEAVADGGLLIDVTRGSGGAAARRLVALTAGSYRIAAGLRSEDAIPSDELPMVRIYCANAGARQSNYEFRLAGGDRYRAGGRFTVEDGCDFQWIEIVSPSVDSVATRSLDVLSLAVTPERGGQQ